MQKPFNPCAHVPMTADETSRAWATVGALMSPYTPEAQRHGIELSLAADVLANLEDYTRKPSPPRPLEFEDLTTQAIVDKVRFIADSSRASKDDVEFVRDFAEWRYQILSAESVNSGRVEVLIWAIGKLIPFASEYAEQATVLRRLREFCSVEWGLDLPSVPSLREGRAMAYRVSLDLDELPNSLRSLRDVSTVRAVSRGGDPSRVGWASEFEREKEGKL